MVEDGVDHVLVAEQEGGMVRCPEREGSTEYREGLTVFPQGFGEGTEIGRGVYVF
jgi:hypothetical protein